MSVLILWRGANFEAEVACSLCFWISLNRCITLLSCSYLAKVLCGCILWSRNDHPVLWFANADCEMWYCLVFPQNGWSFFQMVLRLAFHAVMRDVLAVINVQFRIPSSVYSHFAWIWRHVIKKSTRWQCAAVCPHLIKFRHQSLPGLYLI